MSTIDDERPESDIRKRAAWLLAMLAVVAGLFVLLSVTLFNTSGGGGTNHGAIADPPTDIATGGAPAGPTPSSSGTPSRTPSTSPATSSSAPVGKPSCPGNASCTVTGDVGGAMSAINAYRAQSGKKPVPVSTNAEAQKCALSSGENCPSSFVWVRVTDLSGPAVVKGVSGFNSSNDLLAEGVKSYDVGWAYDPASKLLSCAVIRND